MPLISTSEINNGISETVNREDCNKIYEAGCITISANGGSCFAHYHDYEFAANNDVYVGKLKKNFDYRSFAIVLCAAINNESWRYNYYTKLSETKLNTLKIRLPV